MNLAATQTPWEVVLGTTSGGSIEFIGGPAGPQGVQGVPGVAGVDGPQGPIGPVAAPLATYFLDAPDAGLINAEVIHRGLAPDRVPASPSTHDDEMVTPVTGYDPAKWTLVNGGTGVLGFDLLGGLRFDLQDDSAWMWIEQSGLNAFTAIAKMCLGTDAGARIVSLGLRLIVAGDVDGSGNPYWRHHGIGYTDSAAVFQVLEGFGTANQGTPLVSTQNGGPQYRQQGWWYFKVVCPGSSATFYVSQDGVSWQKLYGNALPGPCTGIALGAFYHGITPAPAYCQFVRVT